MFKFLIFVFTFLSATTSFAETFELRLINPSCEGAFANIDGGQYLRAGAQATDLAAKQFPVEPFDVRIHYLPGARPAIMAINHTDEIDFDSRLPYELESIPQENVGSWVFPSGATIGPASRLVGPSRPSQFEHLIVVPVSEIESRPSAISGRPNRKVDKSYLAVFNFDNVEVARLADIPLGNGKVVGAISLDAFNFDSPQSNRFIFLRKLEANSFAFSVVEIGHEVKDGKLVFTSKTLFMDVYPTDSANSKGWELGTIENDDNFYVTLRDIDNKTLWIFNPDRMDWYANMYEID